MLLNYMYLLPLVAALVAAQLTGRTVSGTSAGSLPNELIAQILLARANAAKRQQSDAGKSPAPVFSHTVAREKTLQELNEESDGGVSTSQVDPLAAFVTAEACRGQECGNEDFKSRWSMPLIQLGNKEYYLGMFFKANWYKAAQFCRFHGMSLAGIESERDNKLLEAHVQDAGLGHEHFWTSGTDQGEEGRFFWMANGKPITYTNWNQGEPNNFQYENGEEEHCLELWNRDGKGLKWNDSPCSFETFFICQV